MCSTVIHDHGHCARILSEETTYSDIAVWEVMFCCVRNHLLKIYFYMSVVTPLYCLCCVYKAKRRCTVWTVLYWVWTILYHMWATLCRGWDTCWCVRDCPLLLMMRVRRTMQVKRVRRIMGVSGISMGLLFARSSWMLNTFNWGGGYPLVSRYVEWLGS